MFLCWLFNPGAPQGVTRSSFGLFLTLNVNADFPKPRFLVQIPAHMCSSLLQAPLPHAFFRSDLIGP
jgi:hypothetical protein